MNLENLDLVAEDRLMDMEQRATSFRLWSIQRCSRPADK